MAEITASMVKDLRERTGLGMMECKKALQEAAGNPQKAEEILRIRSGARAGKAASRIAAEGVVGSYLSPDARTGAMVEVNCETDFVAKNPEFLEFARDLAALVARDDPAGVEALSGLALGSRPVEAARQALVQRIGENITIRRFFRMHTQAKLAQYVHGVKIGVTVEFEGGDEIGKDLAMHIAFARPQFLARTEVPEELLARERNILTARARESGKGPDIVARMVEGGINKFLAEITLLGQPFVKDDKQTVEKMLAAKKGSIRSYRFLVVGEGIEKKTADFAAEVKAQAALAGRA